MSNTWNGAPSRRDFLKATGAVGAAAGGLLSLEALAQNAPLNMYTWSAAVDLVKSHLTAFEAKTGIKVALQHLALGAVPRHHDHQVRRQGADRRAVGVGQLAARVGRGRLDRPDQPVPRAAEVQRRRRQVLHGLDDVQGQAVRPDLLLGLHGVLLRRRHAEEGRHQGAAPHLGRGAAAVAEDQGGRPVRAPHDAVDGPRELADRVPDRDGVLAWRPLRRRQGRRRCGAGQRRRAARAAVDRRRGAKAQDHLAGLRGNRRTERPEGFRRRQPCLRAAEPLPHSHAQRPEAVAHRRPRAPGADARRPGRLQRHGRLDALPRHHAAGDGRQDPRRQLRQADRVVRRQGRQPVPVPEDAVQRPGFRLRHPVDVQGRRGPGQLRQVRGHQDVRGAAEAGAQEGRHRPLVRRVGRGQRHGLAVRRDRQGHRRRRAEEVGRPPGTTCARKREDATRGPWSPRTRAPSPSPKSAPRASFGAAGCAIRPARTTSAAPCCCWRRCSPC